MKPQSLFYLSLGLALVAGEPLSIQTATEKALAGNPRLLAAKLDSVAAQHRTQQSVARRFGDLDLVGQYNHFNDSRTLRPIAKELLPITVLPFDRNQTHYGITWQIPLLAGGALREGDRIARLSQEATEKMALFTQEEIRYNVRAAYRNVLVLRHAVSAAEGFEKALEEDHKQAQLLVETGRWASVDAAKVDYSLQDAHARRAGLQAGGQRPGTASCPDGLGSALRTLPSPGCGGTTPTTFPDRSRLEGGGHPRTSGPSGHPSLHGDRRAEEGSSAVVLRSQPGPFGQLSEERGSLGSGFL